MVAKHPRNMVLTAHNTSRNVEVLILFVSSRIMIIKYYTRLFCLS